MQAIFDDLNPDTRLRWVYPDTGEWDPERNVREFVAMLPEKGIRASSHGRTPLSPLRARCGPRTPSG